MGGNLRLRAKLIAAFSFPVIFKGVTRPDALGEGSREEDGDLCEDDLGDDNDLEDDNALGDGSRRDCFLEEGF